MDDFAALQVRIDANADRFHANMNRTRAQFDRTAASVEARAARLDSRLATTGSRFGRSFQIGNVAQQFQDIAVQAQMGTSAAIIFAQQGPQIAGAFGPVGAVIGAIVAVVAVAGSAFLGMGENAESSQEQIDRLALSTGALDGGVRDLEQSAKAYADAISATATAQSSASNSIFADTKREFEAKKSLLELEIKRQQAVQAERTALLATVQGDIAARPDPTKATGSGRNRRGQQLWLERQLRDYEDALPELMDRRKRLEAEATLAEIAIQKAIKASEADFADLASSGSRAAGGGSKPREAADFTAAAQARIQALREEAAGIGLVGAELERLRARQQAARLGQDLLAKAGADGATVTEAHRVAILGLKVEYIQAADNVIRLKEAEDARLAALEKTEQATEAARQSFAQFSTGIAQAVANARSFEDAMRAVVGQLVAAGLQGLAGAGPFGSFLNALGGKGGSASLFDLFGAGPFAFGSFANGAAFKGGNVVPFASGGIVNGPTAFPMPGGMGLMGEAGKEAIMPLRRGADGRLGVAASGGGGGGGPVIHVDARGSTDPAAVQAAVRLAVAEALARVPAVNRDMKRRGTL